MVWLMANGSEYRKPGYKYTSKSLLFMEPPTLIIPSKFFPLPTASLGDFDIGNSLGRGLHGFVFKVRARKDMAGFRKGDLAAMKYAACKSGGEPPSKSGDEPSRNAGDPGDDPSRSAGDPGDEQDDRVCVRLWNEARMLASIPEHPGVLRAHCYWEDCGDGCHRNYMVVDLWAEDLAERLRRASPPRPTCTLDVRLGVRPIVRQVAEALAHLHAHGWVHGDIKLENVLVDKRGRRVALADFGCAHPVGAALDDVGTDPYIPPENLGEGGTCAPSADVWALGVMWAELEVGKRWEGPDGDLGDQKQVDASLTEFYASSWRGKRLRPSSRLLRLLRVGPADRPSAARVAAWFA